MRIAVTSDLHGLLPDIEIVDLVLLCGDVVPLEVQHSIPDSEAWIKNSFIPWAEKQGQVIMVAGNHDLWFERKPKEYIDEVFRGTNVIYLENSGIIWNDISIFGTPWCHQFGNWSFMGSEDLLETKYSEIPKGLDILISHDSPSLLGLGIIHSGWSVGRDAGNEVLTRAITLKKPRFFFSGHIHSGNHEFQETEDGIKVANVSLVDENYTEYYKPLIFEI